MSFFFIDDAKAPTVVSSTSDSQGASSSFSCALPSSVTAGELLIAVPQVGKTSGVTINTPSGWTLLQQYAGSGNLRNVAVFYKLAAGGETTIDLTASASCDWVAVTIRVSGADGVLLSIGTAATGSNANPDPPSCTGAWNTERLVFAVSSSLDTTSITGFPSGYSVVNGGAIATGVASRISVARMASSADTEDPGSFTLSGAESWVTNTFMVG